MAQTSPAQLYLASADNPPTAIALKETRVNWRYVGASVKNYAAFHRHLESPGAKEVDPSRFHSFCLESEKAFQEWSEKADAAFGDDPLQWSDEVYCRNPFSSDLFRFMMEATFLDKLLKEKENILVIVEELALFEAFERLALKNGCSVVKLTAPPAGLTTIKRLRQIARFARETSRMAFVMIAARVMGVGVVNEGNRPDTLLGVYLTPEAIRNGNIETKEVPRIYEMAESCGFSPAFFPILLYSSLSSALRLLKDSRGARQSIVLIERVSSFSTVLRTVFSVVLSSLKKSRDENFNGIETRQLVDSARSATGVSYNQFIAILIYKAMSSLAKDGVPLKRFILLYENQVIHKCFALGARKAFPGALVTGLQNNISDISNFPSVVINKAERDSLASPSRIFVSGPLPLKRFTRRVRGFPCSIAKAERYHFLHGLADEMSGSHLGRALVIALSFKANVSAEVLAALSETMEEAVSKEWRILIKPHPRATMESVLKSLSDIGGTPPPAQAEFTNQPMPELYRVAGVVSASTTSAVVEAVCLGIPVIIPMSRVGLNIQPYLPDTASPIAMEAWTPKEAHDAFVQWTDAKPPVSDTERMAIGGRLREQFFSAEAMDCKAHFMLDRTS
ncbi:MAG: hypothetical protein HQK86_09085 [Nitrospinae bacterium]|nr:hypothetical protein [Nitrospinota bacterium]